MSDLPVMAPACWPGNVRVRPSPRVVGCWARSDTAPPFSVPPRPGPRGEEWPYQEARGKEPAGPLGLCTHHEDAIFPPEVRHG